jgi:hypothetical protein
LACATRSSTRFSAWSSNGTWATGVADEGVEGLAVCGVVRVEQQQHLVVALAHDLANAVVFGVPEVVELGVELASHELDLGREVGRLPFVERGERVDLLVGQPVTGERAPRVGLLIRRQRLDPPQLSCHVGRCALHHRRRRDVVRGALDQALELGHLGVAAVPVLPEVVQQVAGVVVDQALQRRGVVAVLPHHLLDLVLVVVVDEGFVQLAGLALGGLLLFALLACLRSRGLRRFQQ